MFGFVRPYKDELKVKDYELFRSVYCGLCHSLKKRCGIAGRFIINYDFTFLALLLSHKDSECSSSRKACIASPCRGRKACESIKALDECADMSIILSYWKLRDGIKDEGFFKSLALRLAALALKRGYKRAVRSIPDFAHCCREKIGELSQLEKQGCADIDTAADKFAQILEKAAEACPEDGQSTRRILSQLLYQLGRLIYILDARCDLKEDRKRGRYNPLSLRYGADLDSAALEMNIRHSLGFISSAYELLETGVFSPILENIIYLGLPSVAAMVLEDKFTNINKRDVER
jgi:hypothetical protein